MNFFYSSPFLVQAQNSSIYCSSLNTRCHCQSSAPARYYVLCCVTSACPPWHIWCRWAARSSENGKGCGTGQAAPEDGGVRGKIGSVQIFTKEERKCVRVIDQHKLLGILRTGICDGEFRMQGNYLGAVFWGRKDWVKPIAALLKHASKLLDALLVIWFMILVAEKIEWSSVWNQCIALLHRSRSQLKGSVLLQLEAAPFLPLKGQRLFDEIVD